MDQTISLITNIALAPSPKSLNHSITEDDLPHLAFRRHHANAGGFHAASHKTDYVAPSVQLRHILVTFEFSLKFECFFVV